MDGEGLNLAVVVAVALSLLGWTLVSERLRGWNVTAPMWFVAFGFLLSNGVTGVVDVRLGSEGLLQLAELTLALVLFSDAARIPVRKLRADAGLPVRLLVVGLPLTIALGTIVVRLVMPSLDWWVCAVVGAAIAPTDAALGAAIVEDERVPERIRRVLNVESGLNDGIATPFVTFFLAAAVAGSAVGARTESGALVELGLGVVGGVVVGAVSARLLRRAIEAGWVSTGARAGGVIAAALLGYAAVIEVGGNGFVGAFVAGLAFGAVAGDEVVESVGYTHETAEHASVVVWFLFGALMIPELANATWRDVVVALLALTVVRMVPVALVLVGSGFDRATVGVVGWFGPRGLASVVFALVAVAELAPADASRVVTVITATVLGSVVLHGASAAPISTRFARTHH